MDPSSPRSSYVSYPALRVANPSAPTPTTGITEREKTKRLHTNSKRAERTQGRFRPPGYTSSGGWLTGGSDNYDYGGPRRMISMAFPNPYELRQEQELLEDRKPASNYSFEDNGIPLTRFQPVGRSTAVPSLMYNEGQERLRAEPPARQWAPATRLNNPEMLASMTNYPHTRPGSLYMRASYSEPASDYARNLEQEHEYEHAYGHAVGQSTGVSPFVRQTRPPSMAARPSVNRAYTTRPPALQLGVHGLSLVEEEAESIFPDVVEQYDYPSRQRSGGISMRTVPSDNLTPWRPRPHRDSLHGRRSQLHRAPSPTLRPAITSQPRGKRGMQLVVGDRNAKGLPYSKNGTREWSTDLCLFCDHNLGTCCKALWCPCIIYGRNKARIEHLYAEEEVLPSRGGMCSGDCAAHACLTTFCLFGWAIQIPNRAAVRRRYAIDGDWLGDCAAAFFCSSCELAQESREIDLEEGNFLVEDDSTE